MVEKAEEQKGAGQPSSLLRTTPGQRSGQIASSLVVAGDALTELRKLGAAKDTAYQHPRSQNITYLGASGLPVLLQPPQ